VVSITTDPECAWTAASEVGWITEVAPVSGQGTAQVQFRVSANPTGTSREGGINVNNQRAIIRQEATPCQTQSAISNGRFGAAGGVATIAVTAPGGCGWAASSSAAWIIVTPASGSGAGTLNVTVTQNAGAERAGTITVGGVDLQIIQDAAAGAPPNCTVTLQPTSLSMPSAGGPGSVAITTNAGCSWTAASGATWITITPPASGSGSGSKAFTVAANTTGTSRTGTITVGAATLTVNQAAAGAPCAPSINPTSQSIGSAGGAGTPVAVSAASGCAWTATSNAAWLTIASGANGTGNGTVTFNVAANTSSSRTGTLTIAGGTFTVTQAAPCAPSINPTSQSIGSAGGAGTPVAVSAATGCAWAATSNAAWLTITSGATGTGNGTVMFNVAANTSSSRTGTLTIAGQTFTVNQAATACTYSINPTSQTVGSDAGSGNPVAVTASSGCAWTATANASWLQVTSGASGTGNGTVAFTFASFSGTSRTGTLTIAGQTFTVTQVRCTITLAPDTQAVPSSGGSFSATLTTQAGCTWTATSNAVWLTLTNGTSGTGSKTVNYLVVANLGGARTGRLTFVLSNADEGRLTVNQAKN
jgi:hypothetical protein